MNVYLVPISTNKSKNFNYLRLCFASSEKEAYIQTSKEFLLNEVQLYKEIPYDTFDIDFLSIKESIIFNKSKKYDIIKKIYTKDRINMDIYDYMEWGNYNAKIKELAKKWFFKGFKDKYELGALDVIKDFPQRADFFSDPSRLVFNWHLEVNKNYKHIFDDLNTSQRLPDSIKNSGRPLDVLKRVIDTAIQKVIANYKLAVPHYYQNKIQLLVPLCFGRDDKPDVALVLDLKKNEYYQATTCLSMEMAYMDARLIAKPESNWLIAENIKED